MNQPIEKLPTSRQFEVLVNIYLGDQHSDGRRSRERYKWKEGDEDVVIHPWGRPRAYGSHVGNMGGAVRRMKEAMAEGGLLEYRIGSRGHTWVRDNLTLKALLTLQIKYPTLPDIEQRIADQRAKDEAAAVDAKLEAQANEAARLKRAAKRKVERKDRMEAVLRDYQIDHSLTDDQLVDMWSRIVEEEVREVE